MRHLSVDPEVRRLRVGLRADANHTLQTGSFKTEWRLIPVPEQAREIIFPFAFPFRGENGGIWWDLWNMCFSKTQRFNWFSCVLRYRSLNWGPRGRRFKSCIPDFPKSLLFLSLEEANRKDSPKAWAACAASRIRLSIFVISGTVSSRKWCGRDEVRALRSGCVHFPLINGRILQFGQTIRRHVPW